MENDLKAALETYFERIKGSYRDWSELVTDIQKKMYDEFCQKLRYEEGQVYLKVISGGGVHSFIVLHDGPKFKRGDILKPAGWKAPAKNKARGNILTSYHISWTGPDYLRKGYL